MTCGELKEIGMEEVLKHLKYSQYCHEHMRKGIALYRSGRIAYVQIEC
jgi:hypothetical protein